MIWLNEVEEGYLKSKPPGYLRKLLQNDMGPIEAIVTKQYEKDTCLKVNKSLKDVDFKNDNACKHCGAFLPYYGAKNCKACKKKQ